MPGLILAVAISFAVACGGEPGGGVDGGDSPDADLVDLVSDLGVESVGVIPADLYAASIVALDENTVAVARAVVSGDAFCPDCLDIDPSQCPDLCERTRLTIALLDTTTGELGEELLVHQSFPQSFDHNVNQIDLARLGPRRVGLAWLDCDNSTCMGLFSKQSCSANYLVVDLDTGLTGPVETLYENRFGNIELVAHPDLGQVLAVTGKTYGGFGAGVWAAILNDTGDELLLPWTALGGVDALSPAITATDTGFAVVVDDRRPNEVPPDAPCPSSCACGGTINVDPVIGGLYAFELSSESGVSSHPVAVGLAQDGHLDDGHYHARQVLSVMARGDDLVIAAGQAIDMEAELFVGRRETWSEPVRFHSPIPLWITVMGTGDNAAWLGSEPEAGGPATVNRIVGGVSSSGTQDRGAITEPLDSYIFEAAPVVTPGGVTTTFLLRGIFQPGSDGNGLEWKEFDVVRVGADW